MNGSCQQVLVYDIGGTNLRGAVYCTLSETIKSRIVRPTLNQHSSPALSAEQIYSELLINIRSISDELESHDPVSAVCIAFPGPVDREGRIVSAPGIWGSNPSGPIDILADLRAIWPNTPIHIINDLAAAGYRYLETSDDSFCLVTVSTGIGNKIFINGVPQLGPSGTGGEIGHAKVLFTDDAPICDCGEQGHLHAVSSGKGVLQTIRRQAQMEPERFNCSLLRKKHETPSAITNHSVAEAFRASDPFTREVINGSIKPLAATLANLHLALGLEHFIIIGGFALALGESYRRTLADFAGNYCWETRTSWDKMIQFGVGDDLSGLIGAGKFAQMN